MKKFLKITISTGLVLFLMSCTTIPSKKINNKVKVNKNISIMGRTVTTDFGAVMFSYPGVTFSMNIVAQALSITMQSTKGDSYIDITIDDQAPRPVKISNKKQNILIFSSKQVEKHNIRIQHRSESWHGITTLHYLTINNGKLLTPTILPQRKILFVGDSITCGAAIDRDIPLPEEQCIETHAWWNAKQTFGMLLSDKLNAQAQLVCYGGKGVVRTWQGNTEKIKAEDFYELTLPDLRYQYPWQHQKYQADLAVIALGTNDFSTSAGPFPERSHFVKSYIRLIDKIRADHHNVKIAITDGPMLANKAKETLRSYLTDIIKHYHNQDIILLLADENAGDSCDYHPNRDKHKIIANDFYRPLKKLANW